MSLQSPEIIDFEAALVGIVVAVDMYSAVFGSPLQPQDIACFTSPIATPFLSASAHL